MTTTTDMATATSTSTPTYAWINLYPLAQSAGLVYFKAYVNQLTNQVAGWVNRAGIVEPYSYSVYWLDQNGKVQASTRGTWRHADWAVQGAVAALAQLAVRLEMIPHLPSRKLPAHEQVRLLQQLASGK